MNTTEQLNFPSGPLKSVYLLDGFSRRQGENGSLIKIDDVSGLSQAILQAVLLKAARLSAKEITYLRERLEWFQSELAAALGVKEQTVSLWERSGHEIPKACDVVLRALVLENLRAKSKRALREVGPSQFVTLAERSATAAYFARRANNAWLVETKLHFAEYVVTAKNELDFHADLPVFVAVISAGSTPQGWWCARSKTDRQGIRINDNVGATSPKYAVVGNMIESAEKQSAVIDHEIWDSSLFTHTKFDARATLRNRPSRTTGSKR